MVIVQVLPGRVVEMFRNWKILTLAGMKTARVGMRGPSCLLYLSMLNFSIIREARHR